MQTKSRKQGFSLQHPFQGIDSVLLMNDDDYYYWQYLLACIISDNKQQCCLSAIGLLMVFGLRAIR